MKELFHINRDIFNHKKVIIYGAGVSGKQMLLKLLQRNVKVECFADFDPEKCGKKHLNIPIIHIDDLSSCTDAAVIICGIHTFHIASELSERGFKHLFFDYANEVGILHLDREDLL